MIRTIRRAVEVHVLLAGCVVLLGACGDSGARPNAPPLPGLDGAGLRIEVDPSSERFSVFRGDGAVVFANAYSKVEIKASDSDLPIVLRTTDAYDRVVTTAGGQDALGDGSCLVALHSGLAEAPDLEIALCTYPSRPFFMVAASVKSSGQESWRVLRLVPAKMDVDNNSLLWLGEHPSQHAHRTKNK